MHMFETGICEVQFTKSLIELTLYIFKNKIPFQTFLFMKNLKK